MFARRFRLDQFGNLHASGMFCRPLASDPAVLLEAKAWKARKVVENRAAKAEAMVGFESALRHGDWGAAMDHARDVHVLMLAQRLIKPSKRVAALATNLLNNASRSPL